MGWKRNLLRRVPVVSRLAKRLDALENGNRQLQDANRQMANGNRQLMKCVQLLFAGGMPSVETAGGDSPGADGLPIPGAVLRYLVAGTEEVHSFLHSGQQCSQALHDILARQGLALDRFPRALDFGCGCGRVLRHLKEMSTVEFYGTDCNPLAIQWCQRHLNSAHFSENSEEPPLRFPDSFFNLIFAFSIFTHLTQALQAQWMEEWRRILVPGGYLVVTVHGDRRLEALSGPERAEYLKGNLVIRDQDVAGTNFCAVFHPPTFVRSVLARSFEVVDFVPEGPEGSPPQDVYLMKSI